MIVNSSLPGPSPAASAICPECKEDAMKKVRKPDYGCDSRCVCEYVECAQKEDGASICKTREQNFLNECPL